MPDLSIKAHCNGYTYTVYDNESECVITGGADKYIHIWSFPDCEKMFSHALTKSVSGIVYENERVFVCSESNKIECFSTVTQIPATVVTQFTANINYICISQDKTKLLGCSDDHVVRLIDINSRKEENFHFHKAPVMSGTINCTNTMIASASCDGFINLVDIETKSLKNKWHLLSDRKIVDRNEICHLLFSPVDKKLLTIPLKESIEFYNCFSGQVLFNLKISNMSKGSVTSSLFSKNGNLYTAGFSDGLIVIWNLDSQKIMYRNKSSRESAIYSILWIPSGDLSLLFSDSNGYWEIKKVRLEEEDDDEEEEEAETDDVFNDMMEGIDDKDFIDDEAKHDDDDNEGDEDDVDNLEDSDDVVGDDADTVVSSEDNKDGINGDLDIELSQIKKQFEPLDVELENVPSILRDNTKPVVQTQIIYEERKPHDPIRSGSASRVQGMELLLWNPMVVIKKYFDENLDSNTDSSNEYTEVDFQDKGAGRNLILPHNVMEYHMADANYAALMLVNVKDNNSDYGARIDVRPLGDSKWSDWVQYLPEKEQPICCAVISTKYAVTLSLSGLLRWFSLSSGILIDIECIPGTPVSVVGTGSCTAYNKDSDYLTDAILIVTDLNSSGLHCRLDFIDTKSKNNGRSTVNFQKSSPWIPVILSSGSTLIWIGFSDTGGIYSVDSKHQVRKLINDRWRPVLDLKRSLPKSRRNTDRYFPIGVMDQWRGVHSSVPCGVMSILCCGTRSPRLQPLPHLAIVPFSIPVCPETPDEQHDIIKNHYVFNWKYPDSEKDLLFQEKKMLLNLFMISLNKNEDSKAYGLACMMPDSSTVNMAIRCAAKCRKKVMVQRLGELALQMDQEEQESEVNEDNIEVEEEEEKHNKEEHENQQNYDYEYGDDTQIDDDYKENIENGNNEKNKAGASELVSKLMSNLEDSEENEDGNFTESQTSVHKNEHAKSPFVMSQKKEERKRSSGIGLDNLMENDKRQDSNGQRNCGSGFGNFKPTTPPNKKTFILKKKSTVRKKERDNEDGPASKMLKT